MNIGLTCRKEKINEIEKIFINNPYLKLLKRYDITPIFLCNENIDFLIELCDGVMIVGGYDLNPKLYNQENINSFKIDDEIDKLDFKVLEYCEKNNVPCLGICRGIQVINVYFGGTLNQNINKLHYSNIDALLEKEGKTYKINSYHHQGIDKLGHDLIVKGKSDGIIEMIEHNTLPIIGIQWHPEKMNDEFNNEIFESFLYKIKKQK